ncbi:MAG TPA: DivIVA domain-containing protein [Acidimicrobiales bacterium]|nr:DivIVA domain-containing protein [Acidimicrobiales bacterium]
MSELMPDQPQFAAAMRGYDRDQVDDYVARLHEWARDWRERAGAAEATARSASDQVQQMREQLGNVEERSAPAPATAAATTASPDPKPAGDDRVGPILRSAFDAAGDVRNQAPSDAARSEMEAERMTAAARSELRSLVVRRDAVVKHLEMLHRQLARAIGAADPADPADPADREGQAPEGTVVDLRDAPDGSVPDGSVPDEADDITVLIPTVTAR